MIDPKMIPDEVVEAAAIDLRGGWGEADEAERDAYRVAARAAIAAGLTAWPVQFSDVDAKGRDVLMLVFPLPQKDI
jgi:hypothetical protein